MDWQTFLANYSSELLADQEYLDWAEIPSEARESRWFGFEPASEAAILSAEQRLNTTLPEDLKAFYRVTNGWMFCSTTIYDIVPVQALRYLKGADPNLYSLSLGLVNASTSDEDLLEYRFTDETKVFRSIVLNTRGDAATLLLDPERDLPNDEARYGTWAAWHPGMSWDCLTFVEFFQAERESMMESD